LLQLLKTNRFLKKPVEALNINISTHMCVKIDVYNACAIDSGNYLMCYTDGELTNRRRTGEIST
jgi:hypothetical protein